MENIGTARSANVFKGSFAGDLRATAGKKPQVQKAVHSISSFFEAWVDRLRRGRIAVGVRQDITRVPPVIEPYTGTVAILDLRMTGASADEALEAIRTEMPYCSVVVLTRQSMKEPTGSDFRAYEGNPARQVNLPPANAWEKSGASKEQTAALLSEQRPGGEGHEALLPDDQVGNGIGNIRPRQLTLGDMRINLQAYEVHMGSEPVHLTNTEFRLLVVLAMHVGEVLDHVSLVRKCLGYEADPLEARELIKRHIYALRRKIETTPGNPRYILNTRGVGYRMAIPYAN